MVKPRPPHSTVQFIDSYCKLYESLFVEVRSYEYFKYIHLGLISDIKRKTLPGIARIAGLENGQGLHHFLTKSPWTAENLRKQRLEIILSILENRPIILIIDDTGDRKQGKVTDYVKRQYIGNLGKIENGIVAVTAYGYIDGITFPLTFEVYKPKERLKEGDEYKTKPEIAGEMVRRLKENGFNIKLVLADCLYGESQTNFLHILSSLKLEYLVAIRENHGVWLPKGQRVRANKWRKFNRVLSNGKTEIRYIREIVYGKRHWKRYWEVTTDKETLPEDSTYYLMSEIEGVKYKEIGNLYGLRTWVEYGLKQSKNELGWADFRVTNYTNIEKWWELVMSAYLLVSLHSDKLNDFVIAPSEELTQHDWWDNQEGWKNLLNNLRLMIQALTYFNLLRKWLDIFPVPQLTLGFPKLISIINRFNCLKYLPHFRDICYYSSA